MKPRKAEIRPDPRARFKLSASYRMDHAWIAWCKFEYGRTKRSIFAHSARRLCRSRSLPPPAWAEAALDLDAEDRIGGADGWPRDAKRRRPGEGGGMSEREMLRRSRKLFDHAVYQLVNEAHKRAIWQAERGTTKRPTRKRSIDEWQDSLRKAFYRLRAQGPSVEILSIDE